MDLRSSPRRGLSLRNTKRRLNNDITPKVKLESENIDKKENITKKSEKGSIIDEHSPSTPRIIKKVGTQFVNKTPKSRINLIKSLHKPIESPISGSQVSCTQECEVGWDCDSPGFSKADLKKKHKKDPDSHISVASPLPYRTLFTRQQTVSNKTEEKNCRPFSEIDKLLQITLDCNKYTKPDIFEDSSPPSNGFDGFGSSSNKLVNECKDLKINNSQNTEDDFSDIGDDIFSDSVLESTQILENMAYNGIKSPLNSKIGDAKKVTNITASFQTNTKINTISNKKVDNSQMCQNMKKSQILSSKMNSLEHVNTTDNKSKTFDVPRRISTFRTLRSSFSLNPTISNEQKKSPIMKTTNIRDHVNSSSFIFPKLFEHNENNQSNVNNMLAHNPPICENPKIVSLKSHTVNNSLKKNNRINNVNNAESILQKNNRQIVRENCKNLLSGAEIKNIVTTAKTSWSPKMLQTKSKSSADISPVFGQKSSIKRADSFDITSGSKKAAVFSDDDDSFFAMALSNFEKEENIKKISPVNLAGNKIGTNSMLEDDYEDLFGLETLKMLSKVEGKKIDTIPILEDDAEDLFGSETLKMLTQVEESAMKPQKQNVRVNSSVPTKSKSQLFSKSSQKFNGQNCSQLKAQSSQPTRRIPVVYSKEEIAFKKEQAMKRKAKNKRS